MNRAYFLPALLITTTLAGCANPAYDAMQANADARAANLQITCQDKTTCATKWARAVQWVSENCDYKIRLANDSIITTEGPSDIDPMDSPKSAFNINKVPLGNGSSQIIFKSFCANEFGCVPSHNILLVRFADFVNDAPPVVK